MPDMNLSTTPTPALAHPPTSCGQGPDASEAAALVDLAERAVQTIDRWGHRGLTMVSIAQIDAMACVIAASGAISTLRDRLNAQTPSHETPTEGARP